MEFEIDGSTKPARGRPGLWRLSRLRSVPRLPAGVASAPATIALLALALHLGTFVWTTGIPAARALAPNLAMSRDRHIEARWDRYARETAFIRAQTPPDSLLVLPPQAAAFGRIGNRGLTDFFVFPRRTAHAGAAALAAHEGPVYRVLMPGWGGAVTGQDHRGPQVRPTGATARLDSLFGLIQVRAARSQGSTMDHGSMDHGGSADAAWAARHDFTLISLTAGGLALALAKLALIALAGTYPAARWFAPRTAPGFLAAAFLTGATAAAVGFVLLGLLDLPASEALQLGLLAGAALPGAIWCVRRSREPRGIRRSRDRGGIPQAARSPARLATLVVTLLAIWIIVASVARPIVEWDGAAIWGIKARALYAFGTLDALRDWGAWPEYPPLVPVLMAQLAPGGEQLVKLAFPLFALALYAVIYEALAASRWPRAWRIALPALILTTPLFFEHAQIAYANLALATYVTLTVVWLRRATSWAVDEAGQPWLATGIAAAGAVLARPDGEVYSAYVALIALAWFAWHRTGSRRLGAESAPGGAAARRQLAWVIALPLAADLLWKLYFSLHLRSAETSSYFGMASQAQLAAKLALTHLPSAEELAAVGQALVTHTLSPRWWGWLPLAGALLVLTGPRRVARRFPIETAFVGLSLAGLALLSIYIGPRWGVEHYFNVTYVRLLMVVLPAMAIVVLGDVAEQCCGRGPDANRALL